MARRRPVDRISSLSDAALRVFARMGFRRTQMADIARELNVSPGLLYNYVESKEALFYLAVEQGEREPRPAPPALPIRTPPPGAIAERIVARFRVESPTPALLAALKRPRAEDPRAELESIVGELYAGTYRTARLVWMIDRSALDLPGLKEVFFGRMRGGLVTRLARLIESRIAAGQFRRVRYPAVAARLIIETVGYFARNRRGDPASHDITDQAAEETTIDFIVSSLVLAPKAASSRARLAD